MSIPANRRRLHQHERKTAGALAVAYGLHEGVKEWARRIPDQTVPTDPNLTQSVFAFRAGLAGYRLTAAGIIDQARRVAAGMGRADALALAAAVSADTSGETIGSEGDDSGGGNALDQIALDAPHRLAAALMARLGLGGYLAAAGQVILSTLGRVLLVNREAISGAYRDAQQTVFAAAPDVMGWVWISQLGPTTCGFCYAMHGTWHPDTETLDSHPYCQCLQDPSSLSAAEYAASVPILGVDLFRALSSAEQRTILGPSRHGLYVSGVPLEAMVGDRGLLPVHQLRRLG